MRTNEKIEGKILKNKTSAQDDLAKTKEEMTLRLDDLEKNQSDYSDSNNIKHNEAKIALKAGINELREEIH